MRKRQNWDEKKREMGREMYFISLEPHNRTEHGIWLGQPVLALCPLLHKHTHLHSELHCAVLFEAGFPPQLIFSPYLASCKLLRSVLLQTHKRCFRINEWRFFFIIQWIVNCDERVRSNISLLLLRIYEVLWRTLSPLTSCCCVVFAMSTDVWLSNYPNPADGEASFEVWLGT